MRQPAAAEIIEIIEAAAQLKKGFPGMQESLGGKCPHGAYNCGADNFYLPE